MMKKRRLLIVVDYQCDFVDGSLGFKQAKLIEEPLVNLINAFAETGDDIIFTKDIHDSNYLKTEEGKNLPVIHCQKGDASSEIYGLVNQLSKGRRIISKNTFGAKKLFPYLSKNKYDEVVLAGLVSTICVLSNAVIVKTLLPNAHVVVDAHCSASPDKDMEEKAYDVLKNLHVEIR